MNQPAWPSVARQLTEAKASPRSALEKLIQDNQDFHLLRSEEANDQIGLPQWLRVYWRKNHPEGVYSANDPTGGYPRVLKNVHAWMLAHPDLKPDPPANLGAVAAPAPPAPPAAPKALAAVGTNLRISGAQGTPAVSQISGSTTIARTTLSRPLMQLVPQRRRNSTRRTVVPHGVKQAFQSFQATASRAILR